MPIRLAQVGALGYDPAHITLPSDPVVVFSIFSLMIRPVPAIWSVYGVSTTHFQGYLNEFVFQFNRQFWLRNQTSLC